MKNYLRNLMFLMFIMSLFSGISQAQASQHALGKVAKLAVAPVVHPKRTVKQIVGSIVFSGEEVIDVVHLGLDGLDQSFQKLDQSNEYFGLLYKIVDKADDLAAKADSGLESAEAYFFGSSN